MMLGMCAWDLSLTPLVLHTSDLLLKVFCSVHIMPSVPLARVETHGDGVDNGDLDAALSDCNAGSTFVPPSFAPTNASCMVGDPELNDEDGDPIAYLIKPDWNSDTKSHVTDGEWVTHGDGGDEKESATDAQNYAHGGSYGIMSANWGNEWSDEKLQDHMQRDLKTTPCQIVCVQEADMQLYSYMKSPVDAVPKDEENDKERRSNGSFLGYRSPDRKCALMICVRMSLATGLRLLVYHRTYDGDYRTSGGGEKG